MTTVAGFGIAAQQAYRDDAECRAQSQRTYSQVTTTDFGAMRGCLLGRGWKITTADSAAAWRKAVADSVEGTSR